MKLFCRESKVVYSSHMKTRTALLCALLLLVACGGSVEPTATPLPTEPPAPTSYDVTLRVLGSTWEADISYTNSGGGVSQESVRRLASERFNNKPWTQQFTAPAGESVVIQAQNGRDEARIGCEIVVNGQVVSSAESNQPYGIASCSTNVGN